MKREMEVRDGERKREREDWGECLLDAYLGPTKAGRSGRRVGAGRPENGSGELVQALGSREIAKQSDR